MRRRQEENPCSAEAVCRDQMRRDTGGTGDELKKVKILAHGPEGDLLGKVLLEVPSSTRAWEVKALVSRRISRLFRDKTEPPEVCALYLHDIEVGDDCIMRDVHESAILEAHTCRSQRPHWEDTRLVVSPSPTPCREGRHRSSSAHRPIGERRYLDTSVSDRRRATPHDTPRGERSLSRIAMPQHHMRSSSSSDRTVELTEAEPSRFWRPSTPARRGTPRGTTSDTPRGTPGRDRSVSRPADSVEPEQLGDSGEWVWTPRRLSRSHQDSRAREFSRSEAEALAYQYGLKREEELVYLESRARTPPRCYEERRPSVSRGWERTERATSARARSQSGIPLGGYGMSQYGPGQQMQAMQQMRQMQQMQAMQQMQPSSAGASLAAQFRGAGAGQAQQYAAAYAASAAAAQHAASRNPAGCSNAAAAAALMIRGDGATGHAGQYVPPAAYPMPMC